jgi:CRP-like cAMP-binding protein
MALGVDTSRGGRCPMVSRPRPAGTWLLVAGEPSERIMYLQRGAVTLSREGGDARHAGVIWAVRRAGSLLGIEALVRDTYLDSARAITDVVVCTAARAEIDGWLSTREGSARALLDCVLLAQCADAPRRASSDGSAQQRVAAWLLESGAEVADVPRNVTATLLGMLPETFSRALAALAARSLIQVTRRSVTIVDAEGLEQAASGQGDRPTKP